MTGRLRTRRSGRLGPPAWYLPAHDAPRRQIGAARPAAHTSTTTREAFYRRAFQRYAEARGLDADQADTLYRRWASNPATTHREALR